MFAVLMTTYNSEGTVAEVMDSLRAQTGGWDKVSSIVIADDGSRDQTIETVRDSWRGHATPLQIIAREKNLGEWPNVNDAIGRLPTGTEWVLKLHSDNPLKPDWLETMLSAVTQCTPDVGVVCSSYDVRREDGSVIPGEEKPGADPGKVRGTWEAVRDTAYNGCWWHNHGCAIRVSTLKEIGLFATEFRQKGDWEWLLRLLDTGWSVLYLPRSLFYYVDAPGNLSSVNLRTDADLREASAIYKKYAPRMRRSDVLRYYARSLVSALRREARAVLRRDADRAAKVLGTMRILATDCAECLRRAEGA